MKISNIMKVVADENRLRILAVLKNHSLCVGEIQTVLNITQSNASKHLEKLKAGGLIKAEKDAQWIYYKISEEKLNEHPFLYELLYKSLETEDVIREDLNRLYRYKASGLCCQDLRNANFDFDNLNIK